MSDRQTDRQPGREDAERTYDEADRDVVARGGRARVHDVAEDRVVVVVLGAARAADDGEDVLRVMGGE